MEALQLRPGWAVKAIMVIVIASILLRCVSAATNHTVGGPSGWDLSSNIAAWTSTTTFHVGDSLVFSYSPVHDVLEVDQMDYTMCRTLNPINVYDDGDTVVPLAQPGTRFFICGRRGHCTMGLRFRVDVLPQLASNETRRGGGGRGGRRGGRRNPPPRPTPPPPSRRDLPPLPEPPPIEGPIDGGDSPPRQAAAAGPCERSGTAGGGGMIMVRWFDYYYSWVPLLTSGVFLRHYFHHF
ncbi:hypothetical protein ACOSP7_023869 [Xanthoceras sorbifolium]|uniref:Phytocyanin domain-containing protein n=1 Tax=Xanthoceras sorbifolium TaxID=99658 RepID=A0ABQ8H9N1_9ROSI|nr:hypothetical protein JRO89_XS13G0236000 [Xanthoceras sorbifolium]